MRKGTFSATIAVIVTALIAILAFNSIAIVQGQQHELGAANISLFKSQVQNTEYLVGKTIADALADSADTAGGACVYNGTSDPTTIEAYIEATLANSHRSGDDDLCERTVIAFDDSYSTAITIEVRLSCERAYANGSAIIYKKIFSYSKELQTNIPAAPATCNIIIIDNQSVMEEVNRTV